MTKLLNLELIVSKVDFAFYFFSLKKDKNLIKVFNYIPEQKQNRKQIPVYINIWLLIYC